MDPVEDLGPVIELGDRIRILGGTHDKTTGRVIYRNVDQIHVMPDGVTNSAIVFGLTDEGFAEDSGVESVEILQKRKKNGLVDILDLNVGQLLETFDEEGKPLTTFTIIKVSPEDDTITVRNDIEGEIVIPFEFKGIPLDMPFRVIRSREAPTPTTAETNSTGITAETNSTGSVETTDNEGSEDEGEEVYDFVFLDEELEAPAEFMEGVERLIEIPTSERTYSNVTQKSEAYVDLLSLQSDAMQKLVQTQRSTRVLTELFFQLRAAIIRLSADGTPKGIKPSSIQTLVDALDTRLVAISRCVVNIEKILYHDMNPLKDPQPDDSGIISFQNFTDKINASVAYYESSTDMAGQKFNLFLNGYLSRYGATWRPAADPRIAFQKDEEAFRSQAPGSDSSVVGYSQYLPDKKKGKVSSEDLGSVNFSLVRGLKATKIRNQTLQIGEEAAITAYVLFPLAYAASLSTLRQESLVRDIEAGLKPFMSMKSILDKSDEISDIPSTNQPFLVSVDGGTLGNIPLREYLKSSNIKAEGLGDIWPLQVLLGMREKEWTIDQQEVLKDIIQGTQNQIMSEILRQREVLSQQVSQPPAVQGIQMTPDGPALIEKLAGEPHLKEIQQLIKEQMPAFAASDVALVGLVLRQHPEMAFAQLADQPAALTRVRMKYARDEYLTTLKEQRLRKLRVDQAGQPPEPIKCTHVKPLQMIRKVKDQAQRMALLSKFLTTFQGTKVDNWVKCNAGDHNLLCVHELLQIYQFLRPGDVAVLNKDIALNFGGGHFQGHYICRNCGQPISEVEYDTHLEYDDNGRPMMGRSELVDKDAITQEQIELLVGPMGDLEIPEEFNNETKRLIYTTVKQLTDKLFIPLDHDDYMLIVQRTYGIIQQIPSRERYVQIQQQQRKGKTAATVNTDYDIYLNQALVCAAAVHILLVTQTRIPDAILRGVPTGCRSLGGQPLEAEGTQGIQCVVSVISSFQKDAPPWSLTQFQRDPDDVSRQKTIMGVFEPIMRASLQDPTVLYALSKKRDYRRKILGKAGGQGLPDEVLPANFAPIPYEMDEKDFVEKIIIPEAATAEDRAELWIRQGNFLAKKNKLPMPLTFSEASCCLSPLDHVDTFWHASAANQSLPPFAKRTGVPPPPKITRTEPIMKPSQIVRPLPNPPENSYYLLFLKVCYDGEKKGRAHEFGLTNKCFWCDLKLPNEVELLTVAQGRTAIESQGIDVSKESFDDLLNETHRVNSFKTLLKLEIPGPLDNWTSLMAMNPEPAEGYREVMAKTQAALVALPPDAKEVEVAVALSDFSILAGEMESKFKTLLPPSKHALYDGIVAEGAETIIRFLQSYAVVPLKQLISKQAPIPLVPKRWNLSEQHAQDLMTLLAAHRGYLTKFNKVEITPWLKAKVETFLLQTRAIIDMLEILRPLQVPGGAQTYGFFLKFCLFAPLANFVDPNTLPIARDVAVPESKVEQEALFPAKFISDMGARFKDESFTLTPDQIRELIAKRNEMEKANIIKKMNDMSRAGKDIEKIKIKLGLGDWAVGGTKGVYAYDQDRYDVEREQRAQAGIVDFPAQTGETDGLGYYNAGGDEEGYMGDEDLADAMGFDEE